MDVAEGLVVDGTDLGLGVVFYVEEVFDGFEGAVVVFDEDEGFGEIAPDFAGGGAGVFWVGDEEEEASGLFGFFGAEGLDSGPVDDGGGDEVGVAVVHGGIDLGAEGVDVFEVVVAVDEEEAGVFLVGFGVELAGTLEVGDGVFGLVEFVVAVAGPEVGVGLCVIGEVWEVAEELAVGGDHAGEVFVFFFDDGGFLPGVGGELGSGVELDEFGEVIEGGVAVAGFEVAIATEGEGFGGAFVGGVGFDEFGEGADGALVVSGVSEAPAAVVEEVGA